MITELRPKSFIAGKDKDVLPILFSLHAAPNPYVLDCTFNKGTMWKGSGLTPNVTMDIDPQFHTDVVGSFYDMPFSGESFDVIVFDPPHLVSAAASEKSSKIWEKQYGITDTDKHREGDNVSAMFVPFLNEAKRVLRPDGVVFCKIADMVHQQKHQWQQVDFVNAVREVNMTPCDMIVKADPNAGHLASSKWKAIYHTRNSHCFWIVARKGKCVRKAA